MSEPNAGSSPAGQGGWRDHSAQETAHGVDMMAVVREAGPDSDEAVYLGIWLKKNGLAVLSELHRNGRLLGRMRAAAFAPLPPPPYDWQQSAEGLIYTSVLQSLGPFLDSAVFGDEESRWRPDGTSVQDYFVNKCIFTLKDLYIQEYKKCHYDEIPCGDLFDDGQETTRVAFSQVPREDPEMVAVHGDELRHLRADMTEKQARIAVDKSHGWSHKEIGLNLEMTGGAVDKSVSRLRRRFDR